MALEGGRFFLGALSMIIHSANSAQARAARVESPGSGSAPSPPSSPYAVLLKTGVVDKHLGSPNQSHLTLSRWPTPMFDGDRRIILYELTGSIRLPFGKWLNIPPMSLTRKTRRKELPTTSRQIEGKQEGKQEGK